MNGVTVFFQDIEDLGGEMQACGGGGHGRAVFGIGINGLIPEFVLIIGRALHVRGEGENPNSFGETRRILVLLKIELYEILARGEGFQNGGFIFVRQEKLPASDRLSSGFEQASPSVFQSAFWAKEQAFDGASGRALPEEACLEDRNVITENAKAWRQEVGKVTKMMMAELPFLSAVNEQTGLVSSVGRGLGDELRGKFEVQFGGKHTIQCKSASTSRGQSPNSDIFSNVNFQSSYE